MNNLMQRAMLDTIRERNTAWSECQTILTNYVVGDVAKLIAMYTYGDERIIPDVAAKRLAFGDIKIEADDLIIDWRGWCRLEIDRYIEYTYAYSMRVSYRDMNNDWDWWDMFDVIEFITIGFSLGVFKCVSRIMRPKYTPEICSQSEDAEYILRAMQLIRARFMV